MAATQVNVTKFVLVVGLDPNLVEKAKQMERRPIRTVHVDTCEKALRYLDLSPDADEIWVNADALGTRTPQLFATALKIRHPELTKVSFVASSFKNMMTTSPDLDWKLLPS